MGLLAVETQPLHVSIDAYVWWIGVDPLGYQLDVGLVSLQQHSAIIRRLAVESTTPQRDFMQIDLGFGL